MIKNILKISVHISVFKVKQRRCIFKYENFKNIIIKAFKLFVLEKKTEF